MISEISFKLGIQIILVTNEIDLMDISDVSYKVDFKNGRSVVTLVKGKDLKELMGRLKRKRKRRRIGV